MQLRCIALHNSPPLRVFGRMAPFPEKIIKKVI
jgi:hypothetical protein